MEVVVDAGGGASAGSYNTGSTCHSGQTTVYRTWAFSGEAGGCLVADASGFTADFGLEGVSCCEVTAVGLYDALYASTAAGSARIFAMRSALVGFGGRESEAFLRMSLRSATLRAFLVPRV